MKRFLSLVFFLWSSVAFAQTPTPVVPGYQTCNTNSGSTVCGFTPTSAATPLPVTMSGGGSSDVSIISPVGSQTSSNAITITPGIGATFPVTGTFWQATQPVSLTSLPAATGPTGVLTNRSGTITTGGTAQTLAAVNASRKYLFIENPCTATESLWINFTTAATVSQPSIEIAACGSFLMTAPNFVSTELVSVIATTTAHAFIAKEN